MTAKKLAVVLCLPMMLVGCKVGCDAEKVVSEKLAGAMATIGSCSHPEAIQADVLDVIDVANFCMAQSKREGKCKDFPVDAIKGPIASLVCPLASSAFVAVVGTRVPERYGCRLVGSPLDTFVTTACKTLPF